ncbi:MAG: RluA family pseudouridine synthase, partial [Sutterella wadsworthensis]|nr:RluA family pseudouridine synthase [Sutterella wadsworthensis]
RWAKISASNGQTLVDFFPLTGRTHQLRLHAAHPLGLGSPILGDPYYSRAGLIADTPEKPLKLHAAEIHFPNPADGSEIRLLKEESFP